MRFFLLIAHTLPSCTHECQKNHECFKFQNTAHLDHALERDEHGAQVLVDGEQVEETSEREHVGDAVERFAHVARVPRRPVEPICNVKSSAKEESAKR